MGAIRDKLIWLKENDPRFKDYEIKTYHNDLTECVEYAKKRLKEQQEEELLEEKRILDLNEANNNTKKSSE